MRRPETATHAVAPNLRMTFAALRSQTALKLNLSHAFRHLIKSPGFAIVAIIVMALGIGANTAIFSLVHGVLLQALPFEESDRLVQLWHTPPQASFPGVPRFSLSAANALDWQK